VQKEILVLLELMVQGILEQTGQPVEMEATEVRTAGATGATAHEIWISGGNTGSQTDFVTSLKEKLGQWDRNSRSIC
jgi:hypothetical protein